MGFWDFDKICAHWGKMLITWLFVPRKQPNSKLKCYLQTRAKPENFVKIMQTSDPWGANLWPKLKILAILGAVFPYFCPDKREIWHGPHDTGERTSPMPNFTFIRATSLPAGRKFSFWTTEYLKTTGCGAESMKTLVHAFVTSRVDW